MLLIIDRKKRCDLRTIPGLKELAHFRAITKVAMRLTQHVDHGLRQRAAPSQRSVDEMTTAGVIDGCESALGGAPAARQRSIRQWPAPERTECG